MDTSDRPLIFIVDDEDSVLDSLTVLVHRKLQYRARTYRDPAEAIAALADTRPSVVLTDIAMDGREAGIDVLERCRDLWPSVPVILMSAVASREAAIQAVNAGAFHFLEKPFRNEHLASLLRTAVESGAVRSRARSAVRHGRHANSKRHNHPGAQRDEALAEHGGLIGGAPAFLEALALVDQAAQADVTVLLEGESGTGKGVFASRLHERSPRASRPFLSVNCGALAETLLESQLFGHIKGSFTGADKDQPGLVRAADGGTLFLDEVSELTPATQVKLLRVLQEREVIPVGGVEAHEVDVRFVAATNRDLRRDVSLGRFREDLFWRLNVMAIEVPPLRERPGDVARLAEHVLQRLKIRDPNVAARELSDEAMEVLEAYDWPGNVRELENAIERAGVVSHEIIRPEDLPAEVRTKGVEGDGPAKLPVFSESLPALEVVERAYVEWVVDRLDGDVARAAEVLHVPAAAVRAVLGSTSEHLFR